MTALQHSLAANDVRLETVLKQCLMIALHSFVRVGSSFSAQQIRFSVLDSD